MEEKVYEIRESSIADPGPLGLGGFALTTFVLSCVNAGVVPAALLGVFIPLALAYGGGVQLMAGMWEFKKNNTFGATAFSSYGAFWIALALMVLFEGNKTLDFGQYGGAALGFFLVAWTIFTLYMWIGSFGTNNALAILFTILVVTFILLDIGTLAGSAVATQIGGWAGIITALVAWYISAAGVINFAFKRTVLPVGPRNVAK